MHVTPPACPASGGLEHLDGRQGVRVARGREVPVEGQAHERPLALAAGLRARGGGASAPLGRRRAARARAGRAEGRSSAPAPAAAPTCHSPPFFSFDSSSSIQLLLPTRPLSSARPITPDTMVPTCSAAGQRQRRHQRAARGAPAPAGQGAGSPARERPAQGAHRQAGGPLARCELDKARQRERDHLAGWGWGGWGGWVVRGSRGSRGSARGPCQGRPPGARAAGSAGRVRAPPPPPPQQQQPAPAQQHHQLPPGSGPRSGPRSSGAPTMSGTPPRNMK